MPKAPRARAPSSGDSRKRGGLGDRDLCPHIEKGREITVGLAKEGILASIAWMRGGNLGIRHRTEEREQTANDPNLRRAKR